MFVFGIQPRLAWGMNQDQDYGTEPLLPEWLTRRRLYRGWWVVLVGFFVLAVAARGQAPTLFAFDMEFGQLRPGEDFPQGVDAYLGLGAAVVVAIAIGYMVDRFTPIVVILPIVAGAAILALAAEISNNLWLKYVFWVVIIGALTGALLIGFAKVISSWFSSNRGKAFAVLLAAVMLAPVLPFPRIHRIAYWLLPYDFTRGVWPDTRMIQVHVIDIAVLLMIGIIPVYFVLRSRFRNNWSARREEFLLVKDSRQNDTGGLEPLRGDVSSPPLRRILFGRSYLLLVAASGLQATFLVLGQFYPGYWTSWHIVFPLRAVYSAFFINDQPGTAYLLGALILLFTGVLADRFGGRRVLIGAIVAQFASVIATGSGIGVVSDMAFAVAVGAGAGALSAASLLVLTEYWGTRHFAVLLGILASFAVGVHHLSSRLYWPAAYERDFWFPHELRGLFLLALLAIALVLVLLMKRPEYRDTSAESELQVAV